MQSTYMIGILGRKFFLFMEKCREREREKIQVSDGEEAGVGGGGGGGRWRRNAGLPGLASRQEKAAPRV